MKKGKLIMLVGAPGCGKSTWRKNSNILYVSRDEIRFSLLKEGEEYFSHEPTVYDIYCRLLAKYLNEGKEVIADSTNLTEKARKVLIEKINKYCEVEYAKEAVFFKVPLKICLERNEKRVGREHVPSHRLINMYYAIEKPTEEEGFEKVNEICFKE